MQASELPKVPTAAATPPPCNGDNDADVVVSGVDSEAKERIREQQLITYVQQFLTSRDLRQCHPSIRIKSPSHGYIPRVRPSMYHGIRKILEVEVASNGPLFFRLRYDEKKLRLHIIVPGRTHAVLKRYAERIKEHMRSKNDEKNSFYPDEYRGGAHDHLIQETSSTEIPLVVNNILKARQPDGALGIQGCKYPFLVLELAPSHSEKEVLRAAQDYIHGSNGMIRFVMIASVTRPQAEVENEPTEELDGLSTSDVWHVWVFESIFTPCAKRTVSQNGTGSEKHDASTVTLSYKVSRRALISGVTVYSGDPEAKCPTGEFFEISWADIVDEPPEPCPNPFIVSFADLHKFLLDAVRKKEGA